MKVAFDIKNLWLYGKGIGSFTVNILRDLASAEHPEGVAIDLYAPSFEMEALAEIDMGKFNKILTQGFGKHSKFEKLVYDQFVLLSSIKRNKADILFSPYFDVPVLWRKPLITTIHDLSIIELRQFYNKTFVTYYEFLLRKAIKQSSVIVTVSEYSKRKIVEMFGVPEQRVRVIYNRAPRLFLNLPGTFDGDQFERFRRTHRISGDYILYTGGIDARKNIELLVKGIAAAQQENRSVPQLIVTGVEPNRIHTHYRTLMETHGVKALGFLSLEEVFWLYKNASLVVNTSTYEGFGIPILECLTLKKPILCSDIPVYKEVGKDCVYYFKSNDQLDFKNQLLQYFAGKLPLLHQEYMAKQAAFFNSRTYSDVFFRMIKESLQ